MANVKVGDHTAIYDVMKEAKILSENRVNLDELKCYGFDFTEGFKAMGWSDYFFSSSSVEVLVPAIKELWSNITISEGKVEGYVRGFKSVFTIKDIVEVTGCAIEGIRFYDGREKAFNGIEKVHEALFENYHELKGKPTAKDLKSHLRVLHKIISKCVILKAGSKDIMNYEQKFIMGTYLARQKLNLPRLVYNNLVQAIMSSRKGTVERKNIYKKIPYGVRLTALLIKASIPKKLAALIGN